MLARATALTALLCVACASAVPRGSPSTASRATLNAAQIADRLAAASSDVYANRYAAADAAFATLLAAAPSSAAVHAEDALVLNYEGNGPQALREAARAVALDPHDADAQAVLCRVDDWAGNFPGALKAGIAATALEPGGPLGLLFYGEALSDSGSTADARREFALAKTVIAAHPTAYLTAELQREQANLDDDLGATATAVQAFEAALAAQPHWLYRTTEVVNAELTAGDLAAARTALDAAAAESPDDLGTIEGLGNDAMLVFDGDAAGALWARALALAPSDPKVLDANGEIAVAVRSDINMGISYFEAALRADRYDDTAAAYLMAIATDIRHAPATGRAEIITAVLGNLPPGVVARHIPMIPAPATLVATDAGVALAAVNAARAHAGLSAVRLDPRLSASALSHSFYWLFNYFAPSVAGLGIHMETLGEVGYTAVYPWTRAVVFGYPNQRIGEDITHSGAPDTAVAQWVNSVFHRFSILRPDLRVVGYGEANVGAVVIEDMEFGFAVATNAPPVLYPGAGQTQVPATFVDNELPDPVPRGDPRTTGYPVTVTFSAADRVSLHSFTLTGPSGQALAAYLLAPSRSTENSASLLPVAPLVPGAAYAARISATVDGSPYVRSWTFTVAT
ncbi:MAG: CAP domain-containing protein [Candidatus Dormiibacterota bacterium]